MTENAYIHIPFCRSKCNYCSFVSYAKLHLKGCYLEALERDINKNYKRECLNTLYFGGGTPSVLTVEEFSSIINLFNLNESTEITAELNPENITEDYLCGLKKIGINRLSFGCQTFDEKILKIIGRRHSAQDVKNAVKFTRNAGFENISLDFIYGLPTQTIEGFENDLKFAISFGVEHISLYGLKIDEGCYFYKNLPENLPDEDLQADMYLKAIETLKDYEHYEISNFSKKGCNSRHNLNYWNNNSYYGFGCAAHGYENGFRYFNSSELEKYIENPTQHEFSQKLSLQEQLEEEIFLGFRKMEGIKVQEINKKFNINFKEKYAQTLEKYKKYLVETESGYKFTNGGILISNLILSEFLE